MFFLYTKINLYKVPNIEGLSYLHFSRKPDAIEMWEALSNFFC